MASCHEYLMLILTLTFFRCQSLKSTTKTAEEVRISFWYCCQLKSIRESSRFNQLRQSLIVICDFVSLARICNWYLVYNESTTVRWPRVSNAMKLLTDQADPADSWSSWFSECVSVPVTFCNETSDVPLVTGADVQNNRGCKHICCEHKWKTNVRKRRRNCGLSYVDRQGRQKHARILKLGCGLQCNKKYLWDQMGWKAWCDHDLCPTVS